MVHAPHKQVTLFGMQGGQATQTIPVVVYLPQYDEEVREEYAVTVNEEGKFEVEITRVARKNVSGTLGTFDTYEEAREAMFSKFFDDFDRPSENAINYGGRSPLEKIWDTEKGRIARASTSMVEGSRDITVVQPTPKVQKVTITTKVPSIITVQNVYPRYFNTIRTRHEKALARMRGARQMGRLGAGSVSRVNKEDTEKRK